MYTVDFTNNIIKNGSSIDSNMIHSPPPPARIPARRCSSVIISNSVAAAAETTGSVGLDRDIRKKAGPGNVRRRSSSSSSSSGGSSAYSNIIGKGEKEKLPFDDVLGKKARFYQENYECAFCDEEAETFGLMLKHIGSAHPWYDLSPHQNIK
ncbi:hypothetical protein J3B02_002608 [Coemansia erecta]|uniref:Uncharacterized protein n=1 Tax=Coemansia asiatica TaxID=1052880 RepID=A0A9W7XGT9_9FUNG|nr:hypothetical protein LPJ64_005243 [Coemansia asiatica]KAJ2854572.1 hypothetical protein J3B02_002608 [Coemansia erecta]